MESDISNTETPSLDLDVSNDENTSQGVYRTPYGKKYHFDAECGGENSYSATMDDVLSAGLVPCSKCTK